MEDIEMNRLEAKKFLLKELKKVPNREVFKVATKSQLEIITEEIIVEIDKKVEVFLKENESFLFKAKEIPNNLWFEMVAFLALTAEAVEVEDVDAIWGYDNEQFFNFMDEKIVEKLEKVADILEIYDKTEQLFGQISTDVTIEDLMSYAKSDKADF